MTQRRRTLLWVASLVLTATFVCLLRWEAPFHRPRRADALMPQQFSADLPGCLAIISGDLEGKKPAVEALLTSRRKQSVLDEDFYMNATKDCSAFVRSRGFLTSPLSEEEKNFPIAFSIVIHQKPEMFERLLRAIYTPQNIYCVHLDLKSAPRFQAAVRQIVSCLPNVFIASKLESVIYASWSRVQADLNCMRDLLESGVAWRYLLNTCGADFPIKTNREMVKALKALGGRNSMESEATSEHKKRRWQFHHNVTNGVRGTDIRKSPPPIASPMYSGNAYIVVSRAFVEHVLRHGGVQAFMAWEQDTYSPDEHMWATLQRMPGVPGSTPANGKYDMSDMNAIARAVKWSYLTGDVHKGAPYEPCSGGYRRAVCVYGAGDLLWLLQQHHLLANKFDPEVDDVAIRCLEAVLRFKALGHDILPNRIYTNII